MERTTEQLDTDFAYADQMTDRILRSITRGSSLAMTPPARKEEINEEMRKAQLTLIRRYYPRMKPEHQATARFTMHWLMTATDFKAKLDPKMRFAEDA